MCPEKMNPNSPEKCSTVQETLASALLLTEIGVDLRGCSVSGIRCINQLKNIIGTTENAIKALQHTSKCALEQSYRMVSSIKSNSPKECNELKDIIKKQLDELQLSVDNKQYVEDETQQKNERRQKSSENLSWSCNSKNSKSDINEKYPGSISRESLIDLNTVINLPPVPEDIFTSFTKPTRSSSLSSLKSMRKVKMFLQKAESSDEDDSSDVEEHDFPKLSIGDGKANRDDSDDFKLPSPHTKKLLGNIKEETKFDD